MADKTPFFPEKYRPILNVVSGILAIAAGLTTLISLVLLFQTNPSTALWVTLVASVLVLYGFLGYVIRGRRSREQGLVTTENQPINEYVFNLTQRKRAKFAAIILSVVLVGSFVGYLTYRNLPPKDVVILIAAFEDPTVPEQSQYKVTEEIVRKLREETKDFPNFSIKTLTEHISFQNGREKALDIASENKATMIIWGNIGKTEEKVRLNVNVEVNRKPKNLNITGNNVVEYLPIRDFDSFNAQIDLGDRLSFLALVIDAFAQFEAENYDASIDRFDKALNQVADSTQFINLAEVYFHRAYVFTQKSFNFDQSMISKAIVDLSKAISLRPNYEEAFSLRGTLYLQTSRHTDALNDLNRAVEINPNSSLNYFLQAIALSNRYKYALSDKALENALSIPPKSSSDYLIRAIINGEKKRYDEAIADLRNAAEDPKLRLAVTVTNLMINIKTNNLEALKNELNGLKYSGIEAPFLEIYRALIQENSDSVITHLNNVADKYPKAEAVYLTRAVFLTNDNQRDAAKKDMDSLIALALENPRYYLERGKFLLKMETFSESMPELQQKWLKQDEALKRSYKEFEKAVKLENEEIRKAIADFDRAIELDPGFAEALFYRGEAKNELEDYDGALADYRRAIELFPEYKDALLAISKIFAQKEMYGNGIITAKKVNSLFSFSLAVSRNHLMAFAYFSRGDKKYEDSFLKPDFKPEIVLSDLSEAISILPDFPDSYLSRAQLFSRQALLLEKEEKKLDKRRSEIRASYKIDSNTTANKLKELEKTGRIKDKEIKVSGEIVRLNEKLADLRQRINNDYETFGTLKQKDSSGLWINRLPTIPPETNQ